MAKVKELELSYDPESGIVTDNCFRCGGPQIKVVRVLMSQNRMGDFLPTKTQNAVGVCSNPECFRFHDLSDSKVWVREHANLPNEQQQGSTRSGRL